MRAQGWPVPQNPPILNLPQQDLTSFNRPPDDPSIINLGERYNDGIVFRTDESQRGALLGEFVSVGDHMVIVIQGQGQLGIMGDQVQNVPRKNSWAIVLKPYESAVKVLRQDGTIEIFSKMDWKVQVGVFPYEVGNPVWYNIHGSTDDYKTGTILDVSHAEGTEDIETFTIKDDETGDTVVEPRTNVLIRMALPGAKVDWDSNYNSVPVVGRKPGLVLPDELP
jgi:hypothetical protein